MTNSPSTPQGYLLEDFRLFHLKDQISRTYSFHHHDFLKIMILLFGNVTYVVEGRSYPLAPWDMVLVDRGQVHRPVVDTAHPYERILLYLSPTFLETYSTKEAPLTRCFETAQYRHSQVLRLSQETLAPFKVLLQKLEANTNFRNDDFAAPLLAKALCLEFLIELNRITQSRISHRKHPGLPHFRPVGLYQQPFGRAYGRSFPFCFKRLKLLSHDAPV